MQNFNFANMNLGPDEMKQAEHIWKMLDDMAESNPDGYKQFIQNQVKTGVEQAQKEKEKEIKEHGTKPKIGYLLRMNANRTQMTLTEESKEFSRFLLKKEDSQAEETYPETVKLYLNVCYNEKVLKPLTTKGTVCTQIEDQTSWHNIPASFTEFVSAKSKSDGTTCHYFIAVINEELYNALQKKSVPIRQSFQNYLLEKFQHRLKTDRNPIKNYNKAELKYYKIEPNSITLLKKNFKMKGFKEPKEYLLDFDADAEFFKKRQQIIQEKKDIKISPQEQPKPELKTNLKTQPSQPAPGKAPLIEEIGGTTNDNVPEYNVQEQQDKYIIEIKLEDEDIGSSFELDASEYCVKLQMNFRKPLLISLSRKISKDDVKATLKKKKKLLIIEALKA